MRDKLKRGMVLYKGQTIEEINMKGDLYNPEYNKNWNYSLYFFKEPDPCWNYKPAPLYDTKTKTFKKEQPFWVIKYTLLKELQIVFSDDEYFKGSKDYPKPSIRVITEETEKVIKEPMHYKDPESDYPFMRILGEKKYAFSCYENMESDKEIIIPFNLLQGGKIFEQEIYAYTEHPSTAENMKDYLV